MVRWSSLAVAFRFILLVLREIAGSPPVIDRLCIILACYLSAVASYSRPIGFQVSLLVY